MAQTLSKSSPRARRAHRCAACYEQIDPGEVYSRWTGIYEGEFQSNALHRFCEEFCLSHLSDGYDYEIPDAGTFRDMVAEHYVGKLERA